MEQKNVENILNLVKDGKLSVSDAMLKLKEAPFEDLGFAKLDLHRGLRQGAAEVIYGASKTPKQILKISNSFLEHGQKTILITRMSKEAAELCKINIDCFKYDELSRIGIVGELPQINTKGKIVVATGGTSDMPVAEEAALTAEAYGNKVVRLYYVGVSGLHRLRL